MTKAETLRAAVQRLSKVSMGLEPTPGTGKVGKAWIAAARAWVADKAPWQAVADAEEACAWEWARVALGE